MDGSLFDMRHYPRPVLTKQVPRRSGLHVGRRHRRAIPPSRGVERNALRAALVARAEEVALIEFPEWISLESEDAEHLNDEDRAFLHELADKVNRVFQRLAE